MKIVKEKVGKERNGFCEFCNSYFVEGYEYIIIKDDFPILSLCEKHLEELINKLREVKNEE